MAIKFGPAGLGGAKEAVANLESFHKLGLKACEVAFTYGVYFKKDDAIKIGKHAKKLGIEMSVHAPYWINLNSAEKQKIEASKKRILKSAEMGHYLGCGRKVRVVFHCGFYGKSLLSLEKKEPSGRKKLLYEETYQNIKLQIKEMMNFVKERKWNVELCPEIMGKKNVFGSIEEIAGLVNELGCGFCIDFAHVLARYGEHKFEELKKSFPQKKWHCHFSGIEFGEKGEKRHKKTEIKDWKNLLGHLPNDKEIVMINESGDCVGDSVVGLRIWKEKFNK